MVVSLVARSLLARRGEMVGGVVTGVVVGDVLGVTGSP